MTPSPASPTARPAVSASSRSSSSSSPLRSAAALPDRLDPYGADDPSTETVESRERLHDAGLKIPAVLAIVKDAPIVAAGTRARVEALERSVRRRPDVNSVTGYYDTHSPVFVSHDRRSTYFALPAKTFDDKKWQETGADIADQLSAKPGVIVGGAAVAQEQVNKQVEKDLRMAEMLAFPLLSSRSPSPSRGA